MSSSENKKKGGILKKLVFFTNQFHFLTVTVDEAGEIVKMFWFQPGTSCRRLELINPKIMIDGGAFSGPFLPFSEMHWNLGGTFTIAAQDAFIFTLREKYIPTCKECGVFPTFEHIGYWTNGRKFSQGFNAKCVVCEGIEEPMPFVSEALSLTDKFKEALDALINSDDDWDEGDFV
jgi:hypothetical protein